MQGEAAGSIPWQRASGGQIRRPEAGWIEQGQRKAGKESRERQASPRSAAAGGGGLVGQRLAGGPALGLAGEAAGPLAAGALLAALLSQGIGVGLQGRREGGRGRGRG